MSDKCTCNVGVRDQFGAGVRRFDPHTGFEIPPCTADHKPSGIVHPADPHPRDVDPAGDGMVVRVRRLRGV